jgi:radical SAM superfamily enzyme YgiQ (UPF0313 family)
MTPLWLEKKRFGRPSVAILYPAQYKVGASNLGIHTLYRLINKRGLADFFFLDRDRGIHTGKSIHEFDIIAVSIAYELDLIPLVRKLNDMGFPLERGKRNGYPLLIAGGIFPSANPFPLDLLFDVVAIGEAEVIIPDLLDSFTGDKPSTLENLSRFRWAYIPENKRWAERVFDMPHKDTESYSVFIDSNITFSNTFLVEIVRGCPHKCRFCLLSYITLPPRFVDLKNIIPLLERLPDGISLGLVGSAVAEHPELINFLDELPENIKEVTVSSLRIENASLELLDRLTRRKYKTLTVAPEAGRYKMRKKINKPMKEETILSLAEIAERAGIERLKLYFLIGLPGEKEDDIEAIVNILKSIRKKFRRSISVTLSPFVPKPHTPFECEPFTDLEEIKKRLGALGKIKGVKISINSLRASELEALIARGDEKVGEALIRGVKEGISLKGSLKRMGIDTELYLRDTIYFKKAPYHNIKTGVSKEFLKRERLRAKRELITPSCPPSGCTLCGVCSL